MITKLSINSFLYNRPDIIPQRKYKSINSLVEESYDNTTFPWL